MKRNTTLLLTGILATAFASTASAQDPSTTLTAKAEVSAEAEVELEDDILLVLDLPLVTLELVEKQEYEVMEIGQVIQTMEVAGVPASEATEVIEGEAEAAEERGKRPGFGAWVARRVAAGDRGKVIRELAKMRGEKDGEVQDEPELTEEEQAKLDIAFAARKEEEKKRREELKVQRKALKDEGKSLKLRGRERHEQRAAELATMHLAKLKSLQEKGVDSPALIQAIEITEARAAGDGPGKRVRRKGNDGPPPGAEVSADAKAKGEGSPAAEHSQGTDEAKAEREADKLEKAGEKAGDKADKAADKANDTLGIPKHGDGDKDKADKAPNGTLRAPKGKDGGKPEGSRAPAK